MRILYGERKINVFALFFIYIFLLLGLYVSPLLGFYTGSLFLVHINLRFIERLPACLIIIVSGSLIYSSRMLGYTGGDDVYTQYYPLFLNIVKGESFLETPFGGGLEIGISLVFKVFAELGITSPSTMMFSYTLIIFLMFYFSVEGFFLKNIERKYESIFLASVFVFFNLFATTHLMRQVFSSVFIIYALWAISLKRYYLCLLLILIGTLFHITAAPIFTIFYILFYQREKYKNILLLMFIIFGVGFGLVLGFVSSSELSWAIKSKFMYYVSNSVSGLQTAYSWKFMIFCLFLKFYDDKIKRKNINKVKKNDDKEIFNLGFIFYVTCIYLCLITIPFASERVLMPVTVFILGILFFKSFSTMIPLFRIFLTLYITYRFLQYGYLYNSKCVDGIYCLWHYYPWLGSVFYR